MILHLLLNSLIVFIVLALFIEFFLFTMRIRNSRIRYICRFLPFLKIPFDLVVFVFYGNELFINLNPLSCEFYVYESLAKLFPDQIIQSSVTNEHLIIPQYIAKQIAPFWIDCLTVGIVLVATGGIVLKLRQLFVSKRQLDNILRTSVPYIAGRVNQELQRHLHNAKAIILVSSDIEIPCAIGPSYIVLPENTLHELSHEEREAVIAHELQHLRWKDPVCKCICSLICALCWWIPTSWWLKRLIIEQEQASDAGIYKYGIENYALASAITKILYKAKNIKFDTTSVCFLSSSKSTHIDRIKYILSTNKLSMSNHLTLRGVCASILCLLAFMSFWMC